MQYRPLGSTGIEASVVGLGTWAMGGWMWGGTDEQTSIETIQAALDEGINLIDTAPIYGYGVSETIVGKALKGRRDKAVIATKCGMVANTVEGEFKFTCDAQAVNPDGLIDIYIYNNPDSIWWELERSLKRLGTEHIDLYQTHWQEGVTPLEDTMAALEKMRDAGKIRAIGVCNASVQQMRGYWKAGTLDSDQEKYAMLDRGLEQEQLPYCRKNEIAALAYSPLALGLLTGRVGPDREFPEGDLRRGHPRFTPENRRLVQEMLAEMEPIAEAHGVTLGQLVIAWTHHQPGLSHVLCGGRTPQQARENAAAGAVALSDEDLQSIEQTLSSYTPKLAA